MDDAYARRIQHEQQERAQWRDEGEDRRVKYQRVLDAWMERQREQEEWERRLRREIDPFGWGHWR
jgi:hypothetical protein